MRWERVSETQRRLKKSESTEIPLGRLLQRSDNQGLTKRELSILRPKAAAGTKRKRGARDFRRTGPRGSEVLRSLLLPLDFWPPAWGEARRCRGDG